MLLEKTLEQQRSNDHDLLVRIDAKLETLIGTNGDHETRLRRLEWIGGTAIGALYALTFYFNYVR